MAPSKFQIYVDQSIRQTGQSEQQAISRSNVPTQPAVVKSNVPDQLPRYRPEPLAPNQRFYFDERKLYPPSGEEFSFEELNHKRWIKRQKELKEKKRYEKAQSENEELKKYIEELKRANLDMLRHIEILTHQLNAQKQIPSNNLPPQGPPSPTTTTNRLSIIPQSLQPAQGPECPDMTMFGAINEAPSCVQDLWKTTFAHDKFTLPIDQSQYIRENVPTSTPNAKRPETEDHRTMLNNRRMSKPSVGGSPTLKLSPITETSRDCNSKSSSSSSAMSGTPSQPPCAEPGIIYEPDRPLDPNDPSTYNRLLRGLYEPLYRRSGYFKSNKNVPEIKRGNCFQVGSDSYLVDEEIVHHNKVRLYTGQLLTEDQDDTPNDIQIKIVCFRVDQPANEWLFYICNELHRRLVKQKTQPDIELSVMIANPAVIYKDGSIIVDEFTRFVSLQDLLDACLEMGKQFPKSVAAYITLELIQLVRQIHSCDVIHMNIDPKNILITCLPTRDDVANVDQRTSIVKLINFDRAVDVRLLPPDFKFDVPLDDLTTCEMMDSKPWTFEVDWFGTLNCVHQMFFLEDMSVTKDKDRWLVDKQFKGFPTCVWSYLFDELLNISDTTTTASIIDKASEELNTWVKANISFVLKEAVNLETLLEEYSKSSK